MCTRLLVGRVIINTCGKASKCTGAINLNFNSKYGKNSKLFSSPRFSTSLHHVGKGDIIRPDIILPLAQAQHTTQHSSSVNTYSHVQLHICCIHHRPARIWGSWAAQKWKKWKTMALKTIIWHMTKLRFIDPKKSSKTLQHISRTFLKDSRYSINHVKTHLNCTASMVTASLRQPRDTIVAVTQDLDPQAVVVL